PVAFRPWVDGVFPKNTSLPRAMRARVSWSRGGGGGSLAGGWVGLRDRRNAVKASSWAWGGGWPFISIGLVMALVVAVWMPARKAAGSAVPPWRPSQPNGKLNATFRRSGVLRETTTVWPWLLVTIIACTPRSVPPSG